MLPVTLGCRLVLVYNLVRQGPGRLPQPPNYEAETQRIATLLATWAAGEHTSWQEVLGAHARAAQARMREHGVALCIQDTTDLNYNGQTMTGLGPLTYEAERGLYMHPTYAVSTQREPLGVLNLWSWAREFRQGDAPRGGVLESLRCVSR